MDENSSGSLVVLGCSATKFEIKGTVPAVHLYDGPMYRVLRTHLRSYRWPTKLSLGILSAKYGLIGSMAPVRRYEQRMTSNRASKLKEDVTATLREISAGHQNIHFILGKDYREAIDDSALRQSARVSYADGPIGMKLHSFSQLLQGQPRVARTVCAPAALSRPLYFLPDWDDFLDLNYDFKMDRFSAVSRSEREEVHMIKLFQPQRLCDGVLVSLAQHLGTKGLLRRVPIDDPYLLKPRSVREHFGLAANQWAFGDCGAFSYVNEDKPSITIEQAVAVYDLYEFDLGASVDHIPIEEIVTEKGKRKLSVDERKGRVRLTKRNAEAFISLCRARGAGFIPVGVIQGLDAASFGRQVLEYVEMGYTHIGLGGLVPRQDAEIEEIVTEVSTKINSLKDRPWIHLLGVFRPKLQDKFRALNVNSFDSATYFRKAWLRSEQNYLGADGNWYSAIRVPPTSDPRTLIRLKESKLPEKEIKERERKAIESLHGYSNNSVSLKNCLAALLAYDRLLDRAEADRGDVEHQYMKTLTARPWEKCQCTVCRSIGIHALVFRGYNRNKRRGAHNTLRLYESLLKQAGQRDDA
jgi:hypothetical protein